MSARPASEDSRAAIWKRIVRAWRAEELGLAVLMLLAAGGTWLLVELVDEVREGELQDLDTRILLSLRSEADPADPIGPPWLEEAGRDVTALGGVAILTVLTVGVAIYLLLIRAHHLALFVGATVGSGLLVGSLLKMFFARPRPDLVPHGSYVYTSSFPSGHSMMSALTFLTLALLLARVHPQRYLRIYLVVIAVLLTVAVGASRVYLGVHWPTDVLAGWTAGALWAITCSLIARLLQYRGHIEQAEEVQSPTSDTD